MIIKKNPRSILQGKTSATIFTVIENLNGTSTVIQDYTGFVLHHSVMSSENSRHTMSPTAATVKPTASQAVAF